MRHAIDFTRAFASHSVSSFSTSAGSASTTATDAGPASSPRAGVQDAPSQSPESAAHSLREILPEARFFAGDEVQFHSVAQSAATAMPGQLVIYRIGLDCPSRLIADAMARGAAGILTEQILPCPLPQCIVGDVDRAAASITAETLQHPDRRLLTIGVVGSAGKTSTTLLLATLFRSAGLRTAYQTDLGNCDGVVQATADSMPPQGEALLHWLSDASDCQSQIALVELTDEAARAGQFDAIEFDLLVVTGAGNRRGDFGPSALQCALDRLTVDGAVIAPADDSQVMRQVRDAGVRMVTYGVRRDADLTAKLVDQSGGMSTMMLTHEETTVVMESPLCGAAMMANHAAAAMVGILIDQPLHAIAESLGSLREIPGRAQQLTEFGQPTVWVDAAGSPARAAASFRAARSARGRGRLWCVLAIADESSASDLARYGNLLERFSDHAILTCREDRKPEFLQVSHDVLDGVRECAAIRLVADQERAVRWAMAQARPEDTVLIVGGLGGQSAHQQRSQIQRITTWVDSERAVRAETQRPAKSAVSGFKIVG